MSEFEEMQENKSPREVKSPGGLNFSGLINEQKFAIFFSFSPQKYQAPFFTHAPSKITLF